MDNNKIIIALVIVLVVIVAAGILFLNHSHAKIDSRVIVTSNSTLYDGDNLSDEELQELEDFISETRKEQR